ncbi:MAG: intermembrane transport protein PqiB [Armatimonadetes bacterium]|nr:intermembrane transport protein PqiB [Akkermansiaceae bacterium]
MSDPEPTAAIPEIRSAQRWNVVWAVPILAILIGGWMLYKNISSKGPEVRIRFDTADGISAGKTEIRCRSVSVGNVTRLELAEDLQSVLIYCQLDKGNESLLRKGTRFWVVRPRVSASDISGLGTLLTGVYIELEPGTGKLGPRKYKGRETPPATNRSIPGRRLTLISEDAGSLTAGSPIYYRGYEVGRIESRKLAPDGQRITYEAFIREQYQMLVRENTKFWNTSGIDVSAGVDGFKLRTPSFQAMVSGGVSFAVQEGTEPGALAKDGAIYELHEDADSADESTFEPTLELLLLFDQSVRGLGKSAPVEYRGIVIGRVTNISFDYFPDNNNQKVPVLVQVDPNLLRASGEARHPRDELPLLEEAVRKGLRATLKTGSLLTGAMYVDFDYYKDEEPVELGFQGDYPVVPTMPSGFAQLEVKLASILDKIDALPLEDAVTQITAAAEESAKTISEAKLALKEIEEAAAAAKTTLEDPAFRELPANLRKTLASLDKSVSSIGPDGAIQGDLLRTLDELRGSLRSIKSLTNTLQEKPNSLLFGKDAPGNPKPKAAGKR